jgi:hypothetical protein
MKIKLLVAAAATVVASSAMAQSAFEGFYGQVGTGYESNSITNFTTSNIASANGNYNTSTSNQNANGVPAVIGLGYNYSVAPKFLLGLGIDYSLTNQTTSNATATTPDNSYKVYQQQVQISNRSNIFLTPGYEIDKDKLVYLKAGYSMQQLKYTYPSQSSAMGANATDLTAASGSKTVSGYLLGLGYKQMISNGLYAFGEANYYSYSNANVTYSNRSSYFSSTYQGTAPLGSSAYTLLVGVGYKF